MMMRGLFQLTWLEIKIFLREPLGAIGTLVIPVALFLVIGIMIFQEVLRATGALGGISTFFAASRMPVHLLLFLAYLVLIFEH